VDSLGTEWITDMKLAKFVGAVQQHPTLSMAVSSFGILGTTICQRITKPLLGSKVFSTYEKISLEEGSDWSQVLNPTNSLLPGYDDTRAMGDFYEK